MATLFQNIAAAFDPTVAVNDEGKLVHADGFFDSGSGSRDYIDPTNLSAWRDIFYSNWSGDDSTAGFGVGVNSDTIFDADSTIDQFKTMMNQQTEEQNAAAQSSADRAMEFSKEQAQLNRDWQEMMSNTSYQRAMTDLQKAGLNPKMVGQLGGASTPSGSSASGVSAPVSAPNLSALASMVNTYITSSDSLSRRQNDFVQNLITGIIGFAGKAYGAQ